MSSPIETVYASLLDREYQREIFGDLPGLQRKGTGYIARCPFHHDVMPTFIIPGDRPEFFCFACSLRGDWIQYLREHDGVSFSDAVTRLARASGHEPSEYTEPRWEEERARTAYLESFMSACIADLWSEPGRDVLHYLYARGYATGEVEGMGLGFFPGRAAMHDAPHFMEQIRGAGLVIPYRDASGRLMGLMYKDTAMAGPLSYAPLTDLGALSDVPFLLCRSRGQREVIVVEGLFDALLLDQIRLRPVIGVGRAGLSEEMLLTAASFGCRHFILARRNDERQTDCTVSAIKLIMDHGLAVSILPVPTPHTDIDEFVRKTCIDQYRALLKKTIPGRKWMEAHP